jgi:hypothetical protein
LHFPSPACGENVGVGWEDLTSSEDVQAAGWIREGLHGFAVDVGSVVPHGFEASVRIFHPASAPGVAEVRWSDVAASTGRTVHPEMQFHAIATPLPGRENATAPAAPDSAPSTGPDAWPRLHAVHRLGRPGRELSGPNPWWPEDRAWCVATEIDLPYTYVGGPLR